MQFIKDYWSMALWGLTTLLFAFFSMEPELVAPSQNILNKALIGISITNLPIVLLIIALVAGVASLRKIARISILEKSNARLQLQLADYSETVERICNLSFDLVSNELAVIFNQNGHSTKERVSVYSFIPDKQVFVLSGRYSNHPEYKNKGQTIYYNHNNGVIGEAWTSPDAFTVIDNAPDPATDIEKYYEFMKTVGKIDRETCSKIRMKSRNYAAYALTEIRRFNRIAVIVFESQSASIFDKAKILSIMDKPEQDRLMLILDLANKMPSTSNTENASENLEWQTQKT